MKVINGIMYFGSDDNGTISDYAYKMVDIGGWDMDTSSTIDITISSLTSTEFKTIKDVRVTIRNDVDSNYYIDGYDFGVNSLINSSKIIRLERFVGGIFDNTNFNDGPCWPPPCTSYNRGWITFMYKPD